VVFAGLCAVAAYVLLYRGVEQWFFLDEWDFLANRTAWDLDDLLRPHNEHWSTIPILLYRGLFRVFGLHSYIPFRAMSVLTHLLCAVLLRILLRRHDVGPWLSIAVVLPWIFFGSGWQNIVWGFQIGWNAALALCMTQLLLADHDGPRDARDALGLLAGLAALMCAGIASPLIASVAIGLLLRRGWRVAALHSAPLAVAQVLWSSQWGETAFLESPSGDNAAFVWRGLSGTLEAYAWTGLAAAALVGTAAVGIWLRWRATAPAERVAAIAIPTGLAIGAAGYLFLVSFGRAGFGLEFAVSSRYLHVTAYLLLPLIGVGIAELVRRARALDRPVSLVVSAGLVLLLWAGLPGNVRELSNAHLARRIHIGNPTFVRAVATRVTDDGAGLPRGGRPTTAAPDASIGWLEAAIEDGYLDRIPSELIRDVLVDQSLTLVQLDQDFEPTDDCAPMDDPIELDLRSGDRVTFSVFQVKADITDGSGETFEKSFNANYGESLQATVPIHVVFTNQLPAKTGDLCRR
jgi:hypothetical protein